MRGVKVRSTNFERKFRGGGPPLCVVVGPTSTSLRLGVSVWCTTSNIIVWLVRVIGGQLNNGVVSLLVTLYAFVLLSLEQVSL